MSEVINIAEYRKPKPAANHNRANIFIEKADIVTYASDLIEGVAKFCDGVALYYTSEKLMRALEETRKVSRILRGHDDTPKPYSTVIQNYDDTGAFIEDWKA